MVRHHTPDALAAWLAACARCGVAELQTFAAGLQQDYDAVYPALREPWSTGPVEGHVNRVKRIKRQMFGRANFDLLRQRVLHAI
jgi:transposase